jgi:acyl-CoA synthetase (AMP-forming)/AMP-acid ligase II
MPCTSTISAFAYSTFKRPFFNDRALRVMSGRLLTGVMITHANIAHNSYNIRKNIRLDSGSTFFSWLPQYHDLGLIVAYISTMSAGAAGVYMSPITFIKNPPLWVVGMSQFGATHTACPNFALELAVRKFRPEEHAKDGLDLSNLEAMLNCAEPGGRIFSIFFSEYSPFSRLCQPIFETAG